MIFSNKKGKLRIPSVGTIIGFLVFAYFFNFVGLGDIIDRALSMNLTNTTEFDDALEQTFMTILVDGKEVEPNGSTITVSPGDRVKVLSIDESFYSKNGKIQRGMTNQTEGCIVEDTTLIIRPIGETYVMPTYKVYESNILDIPEQDYNDVFSTANLKLEEI